MIISDVSIFRKKMIVSDGEAHYYLDEVKDELLPFSVKEGRKQRVQHKAY
jgi:hypothetical protein